MRSDGLNGEDRLFSGLTVAGEVAVQDVATGRESYAPDGGTTRDEQPEVGYPVDAQLVGAAARTGSAPRDATA
jgi:hypothetical protein